MIKTIFSLLFFVSISRATIIETAVYDRTHQTLQLGLYYVGGEKSHEFELAWDACQVVNGEKQVGARLLDSGWDDAGSVEFRRAVSFDLSGLDCKPAELTLFSDRFSRQTVWIE